MAGDRVAEQSLCTHFSKEVGVTAALGAPRTDGGGRHGLALVCLRTLVFKSKVQDRLS